MHLIESDFMTVDYVGDKLSVVLLVDGSFGEMEPRELDKPR